MADRTCTRNNAVNSDNEPATFKIFKVSARSCEPLLSLCTPGCNNLPMLLTILFALKCTEDRCVVPIAHKLSDYPSTECKLSMKHGMSNVVIEFVEG
jgi:hypothetical protein